MPTTTFTRVNLRETSRDVYRAMAALDRTIDLDPELRELVKIRASIVNGCAYCVGLHTHAATEMGMAAPRLHALAVWHESHLFTERERAALALTDAMTRLADGDGVPDDVYDAAAEHFDTAELAQLIWAVVAINAWNRVAVTTRMVFDPE